MQWNVKPHLKAMNGLLILELVQICTPVKRMLECLTGGFFFNTYIYTCMCLYIIFFNISVCVSKNLHTCICMHIAHKSFLLPGQEGRALSADLIATGS